MHCLSEATPSTPKDQPLEVTLPEPASSQPEKLQENEPTLDKLTEPKLILQEQVNVLQQEQEELCNQCQALERDNQKLHSLNQEQQKQLLMQERITQCHTREAVDMQQTLKKDIQENKATITQVLIQNRELMEQLTQIKMSLSN